MISEWLPGAGLSTPEGLLLAHELLCPQLPHDIHDHILEGICKALASDGLHVLAIMKMSGQPQADSTN